MRAGRIITRSVIATTCGATRKLGVVKANAPAGSLAVGRHVVDHPAGLPARGDARARDSCAREALERDPASRERMSTTRDAHEAFVPELLHVEAVGLLARVYRLDEQIELTLFEQRVAGSP